MSSKSLPMPLLPLFFYFAAAAGVVQDACHPCS
jgi:hypothetical protein